MSRSTPFKAKFERYSPHLTQIFYSDNKKVLTGETYEFLLDRHGDFVHRIYLQVDYTPEESASFNQGHLLIDYVDLLVGDTIVQRETHKTLYMKMITSEGRNGAFDSTSNGMNYLLGGLDFQDVEKYPRPYTLNIPLTFYFFGEDKLALPLCALGLQEVKIRVKFNSKSRYIVDPQTEVDELTTRLRIEYGYVPLAVRKEFMSKRLDYVMDEVQVVQHTTQGGGVVTVRDVNIINPVKGLVFEYQDSGRVVSDPFNFTRKPYPSSLQRDFVKNISVVIGNNELATSRSCTKDFMRTSQFHSGYDGGPRLDINSVYYAINFCPKPHDKTPTSYVSFSQSTTNILVDLEFPYSYQLTGSVAVGTIYAISINVLRIENGMLTKLWSNPFTSL